MGKKPVLGLVGLAWLGLAVGGCKHCDCDKTAQGTGARPKYADNYTKSHMQVKPQNAVGQQPQEGAVAAKGMDQRYNFPDQYDVPRGQQSVAEQSQGQPAGLPSNLTTENTAVTNKPAGSSELLQTGRTTDIPATLPDSRDALMRTVPAPQGTVSPLTGGAGGSDVLPHASGGLPARDTTGVPTPPAPPATEKPNVPPPMPEMATPTGAPTNIPTYAPAGSQPSTSLPAAPTVPPASTNMGVAPTGAVAPATPSNPVSSVPPPVNALSGGVKDTMPAQPAVPPGTAPLPAPTPPVPMPVDPGK